MRNMLYKTNEKCFASLKYLTLEIKYAVIIKRIRISVYKYVFHLIFIKQYYNKIIYYFITIQTIIF